MDFFIDNGIDEKYFEEIYIAENELQDRFKTIDKIGFMNQAKILDAMHKERLSSSDFFWPTGYGYGDLGREKVESIFKNIFHTESALVRPSIASGTHAIHLALDSNLNYGDELLFASGLPYDTMQKALGITGNEMGTVKERGVTVKCVSLDDKNRMQIDEVIKAINKNTKIIAIQRSTGYSLRAAFTIEEVKEVVGRIKQEYPNIIIFLDNCYGEFTDYNEPTDVGVDLMAGSLIKNPGGGIALSGGYIVGKTELVDRCANKLTAPGIGREVGLTFGTTRNTLQGLFLAPHVTKEALKGALLIGQLMKNRNYEIIPNMEQKRSDIVQTIIFHDKDKLARFTVGIQEAAAVDAHAIPTAWDMPGYEDQVIMASGSFIDGSSIELSCDAPIREPYAAYYQGGLTYEHCRIGAMFGLRNLDKGIKNK